MTDEQAMERVGRGDISALDVLFARYNRRLLYYFCRMLSGDTDRAQDLLQDVFLRLIERPELYTAGRPFSTWIFSIAHNMCKNEYRGKYGAKVIAAMDVDVDIDGMMHDVLSASEVMDRALFAQMLRQELDGLDPDVKATFLLRYQEEFSIRDIADTLGIPEGTVKSRLFNTVKRLSIKLSVYDPVERT